ncbi:hypothetical protein OC835_000013 [Tilletia horrida]|nr:hypothetical protein OC835_000013 [Tilletia horrida]
MSLGLHAKLSLPPASASLRAFSSSVQAAAPAGKRDAHSQSSAADMASNFLDAVLDAGFAKRRVYGQPTPGTPTSGRSVQVQNGDVGRAYRSLMAVLRRDDIRGELRRGERYEKPNQERRRKRSERHRRRFADLVRKKVQLHDVHLLTHPLIQSWSLPPMSAAAAITHYSSSPRTLYRAILRELRKSAPPLEAGEAFSLRSAASSTSNGADLIASAQSQLAARPASSSAQALAARPARPQFLRSPVLPFVRQTLSQLPSDAHSSAQEGRTPLRDLADVALFMRSKRIHGELLLRYNPTHGMTEQERVRATARRVGLDVPQEYDPSGSEANAMAKATWEGVADGSKRNYKGPLPPPRFDED